MATTIPFPFRDHLAHLDAGLRDKALALIDGYEEALGGADKAGDVDDVIAYDAEAGALFGALALLLDVPEADREAYLRTPAPSTWPERLVDDAPTVN